MTRIGSYSEIFRRPVTLCVEDRLTAEYLDRIWLGGPFRYVLAGGKEGVRALVNQARQDAGYTWVFGVVDRDFSETNRDRWDDLSRPISTFVLPRHELENYLLDAQSLTNCKLNTNDRARNHVESKLRETAKQMLWYVTCRRVIAEIAKDFREGFPKHPKNRVPDRETAIRTIIDSDYFSRLQDKVDGVTPDQIGERIDVAHTMMIQKSHEGSWQEEFPGREIYRIIRSDVYDLKPYPVQGGETPRRQQVSSAQLDLDLAMSVAEVQVSAGRVPSDLIQLRDAILDQIGASNRSENGSAPDGGPAPSDSGGSGAGG